ncbi:G-type lectin S-receptor-like serine/threonine-protein kinase At2g19130 [Panicum virgatum]|uniref:G-type lectin S-receptor-like serine/threonine-protein kinase At2g19130 n=1 Tax=Panicum virgatum TaxID=38727 RepID=UPI0019D58F04|nr:G-type lectin S-receptor-like serine/threonine-protein kinase At2g19130 [Panicum virgatum]
MVEPGVFQSAYGKLYLVSQEDRWLLSQLLDGMKSPAAPKPLTKSEQRLADVLAAPRGKLHPASVLLGGGDYSVRRRLGGHLKEAQWMGETVAVKHFVGDAEARGGDTLAAGEALAASDKLISRNGKFALGFFQFQQGPGTTSKSPNTTNTSSSLGWYLGIWFNKIPDFTTVWVANREKHITDRELKLAQLKISRDGNLVIMLSKASTESIIWSTTGIIFNSTNNTSAVLMNNGNLALIPENSSNEVPLWQSFDYPTDVGLPGAKIGRNKVTGFNHQFISKKSLIDPGLSSYSVQIDTNGVLLLRSWMPPFVVYWSWPSGKLAELVSALNALLDMDPRTKGLLKPTYVDNDKEVYFTYTLVDESTSVFVPIDITGQLKLKVWSQATESWQNIYAQPSDFCTTYAVCGPFTFCNGDKRLLEYEHMPNGSLDGHLFQSNAPVLSWSTRYQIAIGVARGLLYLHRSCRFIGRDYSRVLTTFRGTAGYLAPEWLSGVAITPKVDVYSFGMVLQEIISGRRNSPEVHSSNGYHGTYFPVQAISKLHEGDLQTLMDPKLQGDFNLHEAERVCRVACWCIHENEFDRPEMVEVVRALEGLQEFDIPQCQDYLL